MPAVSKLQNAMPGGRRRAVWASKLLFSVFPSRELALMMAEPWAHGPSAKTSRVRSRTATWLVREEDTPCSVLLGKRFFFVS